MLLPDFFCCILPVAPSILISPHMYYIGITVAILRDAQPFYANRSLARLRMGDYAAALSDAAAAVGIYSVRQEPESRAEDFTQGHEATSKAGREAFIRSVQRHVAYASARTLPEETLRLFEAVEMGDAEATLRAIVEGADLDVSQPADPCPTIMRNRKQT